MSTGEKINKNTIPEGFTMGLAIFDAFPVLFFGISVVLLGLALKSPLFILGALLCFFAGAAKVIWKIIVVKKRKNIWWMFLQMRILMPIGFVLMIVAALLCKGQQNAAELWSFAKTAPVSVLLIIGVLGMVLMGVAAAKLDSADAKSNWIEQTINTIAQFSVMCGVMLIAMSAGFYYANETAKGALVSDAAVRVEISDGEIAFIPEGNENGVGLIFYPGGKVEFTAYAPLMREIAEQGVTCVLLEMPLNYAFFGANKAEDAILHHPEIREWYIAGHSLGGVFGSVYAAGHTADVKGMILMGSYSTKSLKELRVLSLIGTEDGVVNRENYEKDKANLPGDFTEIVIEGGNHAMFGSYGEQDGDGRGLISPKEQWKLTAELIESNGK